LEKAEVTSIYVGAISPEAARVISEPRPQNDDYSYVTLPLLLLLLLLLNACRLNESVAGAANDPQQCGRCAS